MYYIQSCTVCVVQVALELLDYHFADEKVRSMAVRRLEKLTNDEVLIFLLQLIQVWLSLCARLLLFYSLCCQLLLHCTLFCRC